LRWLVGVNGFIALLNIGVSLLLVESYGAVGVAVANLVALVLQNVLNQWALRSSIRTTVIDRSCLRCYAVITVCGAALWAFQWLVRPGLVIGLALGTVASLAVLVTSRSAIELGETFPELGRVPVLRLLVR